MAKHESMSKYVYLKELDSVRNTDAEILEGQKKLYEEIVVKGNVVVLTLNQLVDSRGFFSLLDLDNDHRNKKKEKKKNSTTYYDCLVQLFEKGWIKVSMYGNHRSLAGYVANALNPEKQFVFSGWPLKSTQVRLTDLMLDALLYSDLSEVYRYMKLDDDSEIIKLFSESEDGTEQGLKERETTPHEQKGKASCKRADELRNVLENVYWFLKLVLQLSVMHQIYISPRDPEEFKGMGMEDIMDLLGTFHPDPEKYPYWDKSLRVLEDARKSCKEKSNKTRFNRSEYTLQLKVMADEDQSGKYPKDVVRYAEAILNLCYNYSLEISIRNISKHYDFKELKIKDGSYPTFEKDFLRCLDADWKIEKPEIRFLQSESDAFEEYKPTKDFPDFVRAVRVLEYRSPQDGFEYEVNHVSEEEYRVYGVPRYEENRMEQLKQQHNKISCGIWKKIAFALVSVALVCGLEILMQFFQDDIDRWNVLTSIASTILILFITEFITAFLSKISSRFLPLSDAIAGIFRYLNDLRIGRKEYCRGKRSIDKTTKDVHWDREPFSEAKARVVKS